MNRVKYPRTKHLPWSCSSTKDDRFLQSTDCFVNKQVVVTLKMDGECTTLLSDGTHHARSIDSGSHPSRDWLHEWWSSICYSEPMQSLGSGLDIRFCGENLKARHTLEYTTLRHYFYLHSVWVGNTCLDWINTLDIADALSLFTVPTMYRGLYNEKEIREHFDNLITFKNYPVEGYVVRLAADFTLDNFGSSVAKYVRPDFKIGTQHWSQTQMVCNGTKNNS